MSGDSGDSRWEGIHPTAIVHHSTVIRPGVMIGPFTVVGNPGNARPPTPAGGVVIGKETHIHATVVVDGGVKIGSRVTIMAGAFIGHNSIIEDDATIYPHAVIGGNCRIGAYAGVGLNASVHQQSSIGEGTFIGGQSFFKGHTGSWELWYGVPARHRGVNEVGLERSGLALPRRV